MPSVRCWRNTAGRHRWPHVSLSAQGEQARANIQIAKAIIDVTRLLGISVHDHIIVGKTDQASFKGLRLI
jgi:DNA repair protein RadC